MNKFRIILLILVITSGWSSLHAEEADGITNRKISTDAVFYTVLTEFAERVVHKEYGRSLILYEMH